jgi:hypothetical protein
VGYIVIIVRCHEYFAAEILDLKFGVDAIFWDRSPSGVACAFFGEDAKYNAGDGRGI